MIISHRHKFIFVAVPRTATHSHRKALRPHLGPHDWEQCLLFGKKAFPVEPIARLEHGHITCRQIKPYLLPQMWTQYFKFCVVRNPYDRFVSLCWFFNRDNPDMRRDPLGIMKQMIQDKRHRLIFEPQHTYVTDEKGQTMVDYVGRYEALQPHFDEICRRIGLPLNALPQMNASAADTYRASYDQELQDMVQAYYARDFVLFDYPVDMRS